ncbi:MAG: hypothetical protein D6690_14680 [Nitrospirae bacterium]|nr:MAG: hypothetical protein D6690_14680 [Nitrospirota bacterium]
MPSAQVLKAKKHHRHGDPIDAPVPPRYASKPERCEHCGSRALIEQRESCMDAVSIAYLAAWKCVLCSHFHWMLDW